MKAALLDGVDLASPVASTPFATDRQGVRVEVPVERIEAAIRQALDQLVLADATYVALTGMSPAWLAVRDAKAITPVVTHQDRRSVAEAVALEERVGRERHLQLAGNRPTPGGISSTTAAWFATHTDAIERADLLCHLPTYLGLQLTGEAVADPSNAGFMGLMDVTTGGWSQELCDAAGVPMRKLPAIRDASETIGTTRPNGLGVPIGLPLFGGVVDGSGPLLLADRDDAVVHSAGSTDVVAAVVDRPIPADGLLCRPLGTGGRWVVAATQAAGSAGWDWAVRVLGPPTQRLAELARYDTPVVFHPHLAGDRQQVVQPMACFDNLTLATDRSDLHAAVLQALLADHADRVRRVLEVAGDRPRPVLATGGGGDLPALLREQWPAGWSFAEVDQATLRGLGRLRRTPEVGVRHEAPP